MNDEEKISEETQSGEIGKREKKDNQNSKRRSSIGNFIKKM